MKDRGHTVVKDNYEINLNEIKFCLKNAWKTVAIFGVLGLLGASLALFFASKRFDAVAQIRIAQMSQFNATFHLGVPIEEPAALIARLQFPTNYTKDVIEACGYQDAKNPEAKLLSSIKYSIPKGVANIIEFKFTSSNAQTLSSCANSIFEFIRTLQEKRALPLIEEALLKIDVDDKRINQIKKTMETSDSSGKAFSASYLSAREELNYYLLDRERAFEIVNSIKNRKASLVSPIYIIESKPTLSKSLGLVLGFMGGLLFGIFAILVKYLYAKLKGRSVMDLQ